MPYVRIALLSLLQMVKQRNLTIVLLITCFLSSCSRQINICDYIDNAKPLEMTIIKADKLAQFDTIKKIMIPSNSDKYLRLIQWAECNKTGWQITPASFVSEICITQDDFRLLYTSGSSGVVIGFTGTDKKPVQYSKSILSSDLDFLFK